MRRPISEEVKAERRANAIATLKSLIFPLVLFAIIAAAIIFVMNYQNAQVVEPVIPVNAYDGDNKPVVMENEYLKFTLDPVTTTFEVLVKKTGAVWKSNPEGGSTDPVALESEKQRLQSTLLVEWATQTGLKTTYDSFSMSAANGIYEIETGDNSVTVNYSLGKVPKQFTLPTVIKASDFEGYFNQMDKDGQNKLSSYYKKYDINNLGKKDDKEELLTRFPILETEPIYWLRDTTKDGMKKELERIFEEVGYTYEAFVEDKKLDASEKVNDNPVYNASIVYKLDGENFVVEVPFDKMKYNEEKPIYTITPIPYFGCGTTSEDGFMFVPEGGGSIINFNNGRTLQPSYVSNVYDWDMCLSRTAVVHSPRADFGVYGISKGNNSFICMIEDGSSYGIINADVSKKLNSYNYVYCQFNVAQREQFNVGSIANTDVYKFSTPNYDEKVSLRYSFVNSGSYVDMAKDYQRYLIKNYEGYFTKNDDTSAPLALDILGAVDKVKQIMGVPVSRPWKLTTYKEAAELIRQFDGYGYDNIYVKLSGWCNGGVAQQLMKSVKPISSLGSSKDLANVAKTANDLGVKFFLNGVSDYEYDSNILDGFISFRDAAKLISKERVKLHAYSHVTYSEAEWDDDYYLLHADLRAESIDNLVAYAKKINANVAFENVGSELSSDYYVKKTVTREDERKSQVEKLKAIADGGNLIMINSGNDYAMPYADMITSMDLRGNMYTILDDYVPFYQIAIHGFVNYTGLPLNICGNTSDELLACAEYGAGLQFSVMQESSFALQKTLYPEYYGSDITAWGDRLNEIYTRYNAELGHTFNQEIVDHQSLSDLVSVTVYEDGTKVYVNYGYNDYAGNGVKVSARDYKVVR